MLITVLTATLAFSSCNKKSSVSVNGVPVSEGVYNYYYDIEKNSDEDKSQQELSDAALSDVATYVAVNSEFKTVLSRFRPRTKTRFRKMSIIIGTSFPYTTIPSECPSRISRKLKRAKNTRMP